MDKVKVSWILIWLSIILLFLSIVGPTHVFPWTTKSFTSNLSNYTVYYGLTDEYVSGIVNDTDISKTISYSNIHGDYHINDCSTVGSVILYLTSFSILLLICSTLLAGCGTFLIFSSKFYRTYSIFTEYVLLFTVVGSIIILTLWIKKCQYYFFDTAVFDEWIDFGVSWYLQLSAGLFLLIALYLRFPEFWLLYQDDVQILSYKWQRITFLTIIALSVLLLLFTMFTNQWTTVRTDSVIIKGTSYTDYFSYYGLFSYTQEYNYNQYSIVNDNHYSDHHKFSTVESAGIIVLILTGISMFLLTIGFLITLRSLYYHVIKGASKKVMNLIMIIVCGLTIISMVLWWQDGHNIIGDMYKGTSPNLEVRIGFGWIAQLLTTSVIVVALKLHESIYVDSQDRGQPLLINPDSLD